MAVAKTNPLPVGLYTMDLPQSAAPRLAAWTKANRGKVIVRKVEAHPDASCAVAFEIIGKPGAFPFGAVGYPTIASSSTGGALLDDAFGWMPSTSQLEGLALLWVLWQLTKR